MPSSRRLTASFAFALVHVIAGSLAFVRPALAQFDVLIKSGTLYDGTGEQSRTADVALQGDRIAAVGDLSGKTAKRVIDATGLAVAPGFINMLSWSTISLIHDGRSQSEIRQGVTTEIMGEGESMGPLNDAMKKRIVGQQGDIKFDIKWTTLAEYLRYLEQRGVSPNVASFIGATTIREHVIGLEDKQPTPQQLEQMRELVRGEMGSWRARHWHVAHLPAGLLRQNRRAHRAVQSRCAISGQIHFPHTKRRKPAARRSG
jgi:N-acyl-D-amino-acid deacylase